MASLADLITKTPNIKEADCMDIVLEHSKLPIAIYIPHCLLPPLLNERHIPMQALAVIEEWLQN
eukprot:5780571-Ditylum_brightwellii.AAC.1